jgi:hypothetical protein
MRKAMTKSLFPPVLGCAIALCAGAVARAQTPVTYRLICQAHGGTAREELPDRKGHVLISNSASCRVEGGPMDGAAQSSSSVSSGEGDDSTTLSSYAIKRKAASWTVSVVDTGKSSLQRSADGKVTGSAGSGYGRFLLGVGDGAALAGRKFSYNYKTIAGQTQYVVDVKVE